MTRESTLSRLVKQDHQIEGESNDRMFRLMEHRWKAVNEHGFSIKEYARALDRNERGVRAYIRAWDEHLKDAEGAFSPADLLERALHGVDTNIALDAIAKAEGVSITTVRQSKMPEVQRVRQYIEKAPPEEKQERAEHYVETTRKMAQARQSQTATRRRNVMQSVMDLELELDKARRALGNAVVIARDSTFANDDLREHIIEVLAQVRLLTEQLSMQIAGRVEVDWDTEAQKLIEAEGGAR